jgi:hypothetical protein
MRNSLLSTTSAAGLAAAFALLATPAGATVGSAHTEVLAPITAGMLGDFSSQALSIPTFDTTKGNLTSVLVFEKLSASYYGTASLSASGNSGNFYSGSAQLQTSVYIAGKPGVLDGSPVFSLTASAPLALAPGSSQSYTSTGNTASHGPFNYTAGSSTTGLGNWKTTGPGTVVASLSTVTELLPTPVGGLSIDPPGELSFALDITYDFTTSSGAIPEPASALMIGAGVIGLGAVRRRRKRKSNPG